MRRIVLGVFLLSISMSASAIVLSDTTVSVPIIGRFPGVNSTQWQTDLFIGNPFTPTATVTLRFYTAAGLQTRTVTVPPFGTLTLRDVVLNTFGSATAAGPLEVISATSVETRARIYNVGNAAGEFGQNAPGIGRNRLSIQSYIYGLSGVGGNRVNIGVTNPNDTSTTVSLQVADRNRNTLAVRSIDLGPHQNVQFNDIFATFGITPQEGVTISFEGSNLIYGYASEVRNDTGDAIFLFGTAPNTGP